MKMPNYTHCPHGYYMRPEPDCEMCAGEDAERACIVADLRSRATLLKEGSQLRQLVEFFADRYEQKKHRG